MALARDAAGDKDKTSVSDNGRVLPLAAVRSSLARESSVSKATTFEVNSCSSASCLLKRARK